MAQTLSSDSAQLLRSLAEVRPRQREVVRKLGHKASVLAKLRDAGVPLPPTWLLTSAAYTAFLQANLPGKHDLKTLIRLSGTRDGDERCARAHEHLRDAALNEATTSAMRKLWLAHMQHWSHGVAVRTSVAGSGANLGAAARHLVSQLKLTTLDAVVDAVRELWASSVLACSVQALAEARLSDAAIAVVMQPTIAAERIGLLTRALHRETGGEASWYLGVEVQCDGPRWRLPLLAPIAKRGDAERKAAEGAPGSLETLREQLEADGFERLMNAAAIAEQALGPHVVLRFALRTRSDGSNDIVIITADDSPRWSLLRGGHQRTAWVELAFGDRPNAPPTRLTHSLLTTAARRASHATLEQLHCYVDGDEKPVGAWAARSYLNVDALLKALRNAPLLTPEDVLAAVGGPPTSWRRRVAGRAAARTSSLWQKPRIGAAAVRAQLAIDDAVEREQRRIETELKQLSQMDLTLLPNDALGTTLAGAQALLERVTELWVRITAAQLVCRAGLRAVVQRRLPEAPAQLAYTMTSARRRSFAGAIAEELEHVVARVRRDHVVLSQLRAGVRRVDALPDGSGRGALGIFIANYGHAAFSALELSTPRWCEDPTELLDMVTLLASDDMPARIDERRREAAALNDRELARYEPAISRVDRRLLRWLSDRARATVQLRSSVDRLTTRVMLALRAVALDIDRRLRRIDPTIPAGGAFHCSAARLVAALKSGRPELGRIIRMRLAERALFARKPPPPLAFVGSPPRRGTLLSADTPLSGLPLSAGVIDGRVRVVSGRLPADIAADDVLVVRQLDAVMGAVYARAAAVVAEGGGCESVAAELLRELAIPAVGSIGAPLLQLDDGDRVRVDGTRGVVERLDADHRPTPSRRFLER